MGGKVEWPPVGSCVAHRGAAGTAPENTVVGAATAIRQGATIIEIDVQRTADGELIVFHDSRLGRTTDIADVLPDRARRMIGEMTVPELRKLDAGGWFDERYRGASVPTLAEMLDAVSGKATLFIELKWPERYPGIIGQLVEELRRCVGDALSGPDTPVAIQLVETDLLRELRDGLPEQVPLCLMTGLVPPLPVEEFPRLADWISGYVPLGRELEPGYIDRVHEYGVRVCPWTIDAPEAVDAMLRLGADGVITNYLPEVIPVMRGEASPLPRRPVRIEAADPGSETFVLRNVGDAPVALSGWSVRNQLMVRQFLPDRTLAPGEPLALPSASANYLDNYGENLALHDPADGVVDLHAYRLRTG